MNNFTKLKTNNNKDMETVESLHILSMTLAAAFVETIP